MDAEKGESKTSSKKKKMPAADGMDVSNQRQQKNLPINESQPMVQFPITTTAEKAKHGDAQEMPQNQMDAEKGESKKSSKKNKPKDNGSKMVVMNEEQDPFDTDVRPLFPEVQFPTATTAEKPMINDLKMPQQVQMDSQKVKSTKNELDVKGPLHQENSSVQLTSEQPKIKQEQQALNRESQKLGQQKEQKLEKQQQKEDSSVMRQQHQMDSDKNKNAKKQKSTELDVKELQQEIQNVSLTSEQSLNKEEQQVQLTLEQQQMKEERQKLDQDWLRLGLEEQKLKQQHQEQQNADQKMKTFLSMKIIQPCATKLQIGCCSAHVKVLTPLIGSLHLLIITALFLTEVWSSNVQNLKGIEIAGFILLGCSLLTVAALFIGLCLKDAKFLFGYVCYGVLEIIEIFIFMIVLCIEFGGLTPEQLRFSPTTAIILTVLISVILILLRIWLMNVAFTCAIYYSKVYINTITLLCVTTVPKPE